MVAPSFCPGREASLRCDWQPDESSRGLHPFARARSVGEDQLLPSCSISDVNPAGAHRDPEDHAGKSSSARNQYDAAFNREGLFAYDADMGGSQHAVVPPDSASITSSTGPTTGGHRLRQVHGHGSDTFGAVVDVGPVHRGQLRIRRKFPASIKTPFSPLTGPMANSMPSPRTQGVDLYNYGREFASPNPFRSRTFSSIRRTAYVHSGGRSSNPDFIE